MSDPKPISSPKYRIVGSALSGSEFSIKFEYDNANPARVYAPRWMRQPWKAIYESLMNEPSAWSVLFEGCTIVNAKARVSLWVYMGSMMINQIDQSAFQFSPTWFAMRRAVKHVKTQEIIAGFAKTGADCK